MKPITTAELLKLVSDTHNYDGSFAPQVRRAVAEVFRLRRKLSVMQANKPVQMIGGQTFTITQQFKGGVDPDKIAAIFERDMVKLAENRIQARTTIPFERRNVVYTHQDPGDTSHTTTEGRTPDFEFPGPWVRFEMSKREMEQQILEEGEVIYLETGLNADVEVVSNDTKDPEAGTCCVRALNSDGLKWIMKRPEIVDKVSKIEYRDRGGRGWF